MGSRCVFVTHKPDGSGGPFYNWFEARKVCAEMVADTTWTADLVSNYDVAFQKLLTKHIKAYPDTMTNHNYHVGAATVNGTWLWLDDTPISKMDYLWYIFCPSTTVSGFMTAGVSFQMPSPRLVLGQNSANTISPHYVCEAKPAAA